MPAERDPEKRDPEQHARLLPICCALNTRGAFAALSYTYHWRCTGVSVTGKRFMIHSDAPDALRMGYFRDDQRRGYAMADVASAMEMVDELTEIAPPSITSSA